METFELTGYLQVETAADALEAIRADPREIKRLRRKIPTNGTVPEGITGQRANLHFPGLDSSLRTEIFRGLEAQIFDNNTPTSKKIAAEALWEVLTEDLIHSLENENEII